MKVFGSATERRGLTWYVECGRTSKRNRFHIARHNRGCSGGTDADAVGNNWRMVMHI